MRGEMLYLLFSDIEQINVTIRRGVCPVQRQPVLITANRAQIQSEFILVKQRSDVGLRVITVQIEKTLIALVVRHIKSTPVRAPSHELGLEPVPGSQVCFITVGSQHEKMKIFVAAPVPGKKNSIVAGEEADRKD